MSIFRRPRTSVAPPAATRTVCPGLRAPHYGDNAIVSSKYTWFNMLPKAIFEQFRRLSNFYFLIVAAVSFIPNISPSSPITTTLPLIVVVGFGLARDVYEDCRRKRADALVNATPVYIHQQHPSNQHDIKKHAVSIPSRQLLVGDIVRVTNGHSFPADLVLLSSSTSATCFVSTANLDGESNLKRRHVPSPLVADASLPHDFSNRDVELVIASPIPDLYSFEGVVKCDGDTVPLDVSNLLLRGSILRNTDFVYGVVVYNGQETKVALNMRSPPSKMGGIERVMNRVVIGMFSLLVLITVLVSVVAGIWQHRYGLGQWYMGDDRTLTGASVAFRSLGTFVILFHTFVPVSLFVTLEFVRIIQGLFISADRKMVSPTGPVEAKANNLNESLGYVHHIFSDKTGTLTENVMRFVACSVANSIYDLREKPACLLDTSARMDVTPLLRAMALAHDVMPGAATPGATGDLFYGESPDEVALVEAACEAGVRLSTRSQSNLVLDLFGSKDTYELLAELPFTSERKRMSVVFLCPDGIIRIFTKGADSVMLDLMNLRAGVNVSFCADEFAKDGLRTLVYACRVVPDDEFQAWKPGYVEASNAMEDRTRKKGQMAALLEQSLEFLGVTAVEDKLQENVPSTIKFLRDADIRVWVLTGDKRETAENIGYSSHLLGRDMDVFHIYARSDIELREQLEIALEKEEEIEARNTGVHIGTGARKSSFSTPKRHHRRQSSITASLTLRVNIAEVEQDMALIIDGGSLALVQGEELESMFLQVARKCKSVICARVTPLQKAMVVRLVRRNDHSNTLAIGDGGNDVSMIQEAHIGVGIKGKEGMQASRAADYAMGEFQHLRRLLAVHGRFSYIRTAGVINLSFYKNIFFSGIQILFQFFCFASGTTFHNQWIVTAWNSMLTLLPPFLYGIFERDLEESTLLTVPKVYGTNNNNKLFSMRTVLEFTLAYSAWHALVLFFLTYLLFGHSGRTVFPSGHDGGFFLTGLAVSTMAVPIALAKFLLSSHLWSGMVLFGVGLSFVLSWALIPVFVELMHEEPLRGVLAKLISSPTYHLLWPVVFVCAFLPDFLVIVTRLCRQDNLVARLQNYEARNVPLRET